MLPEQHSLSYLHSLDDAELFRRIRGSSADALDVLAERYIQKLVASAMVVTGSIDLAEDAVQETFIKLWDAREYINIHSSVVVYLIQAVRHRAQSLMRREGAQYRLGERLALGVDDAPASDLYLLNAERNAAVRKALSELPPKAQEVLLLRIDFGLTNAEIANALGIAVTTVKTHVVRATRTLADKLAAWKRA